MELREWLIILGLALVTLIVVDGVRRLQRQRRVPRLDQVEGDARESSLDPEEAAREAEINWELPNGGARVVRPADYSRLQPKPKLERQEHPGPSRVLAGFRRAQSRDAASESTPASAGTEARKAGAKVASATEVEMMAAPEVKTPEVKVPEVKVKATPEAGVKQETPPHAPAANSPAEAGVASEASAERREPSLSLSADASEVEPEASAEALRLAADPQDHDEQHDAERYRLVDLEGMSDSLKSGSRRVGASLQRSLATWQQVLAERREQRREAKARREKAKAEQAALAAERKRLAEEEAARKRAAREAERERQEAEAIAAADDDDPLFAPSRRHWADQSVQEEAAFAPDSPTQDSEPVPDDDKVRVHPVLEKALRHDVSAEQARYALSHAEEVIVISVMCRDEAGFSGTALLDLMLACGLRYSSDMGIFHRFETENPESQLQFSMVNVLKPGTFPIEAMDDFRTPGVTLLMPLPGAEDASAAFEAMVETAMVIVRHLGGELKDENHSVMTAQTVEFARQRVQEFVRRNRLHRYQVN